MAWNVAIRRNKGKGAGLPRPRPAYHDGTADIGLPIRSHAQAGFGDDRGGGFGVAARIAGAWTAIL